MILEDYLDSFQGIVITVSHDRYFLDRVVGRIFAFEGDGKLPAVRGRIYGLPGSEGGAGSEACGEHGGESGGSEEVCG